MAKIKEATPIYIYPQEVNNFPAYLEITLKTLSGGNFVNELKNELINTAGSAIKFITDTAATFGAASVDTLTSLVLDQNTGDSYKKAIGDTLNSIQFGNKNKDYFAGTKKLKFVTYIPADFESRIVTNWSESELFGGVNTVLNNIDKLPFAGSLIGAAYNALKNNAQAISKTALTPKMLKLFQPSFFDFDLNFEYVMDNPTDSKNFITLMRCFQESQRPFNNNNEELYSFPAVFDIKIRLNNVKYNPDGSARITTKVDNVMNLWNHITSQNGYGLTNISIMPKSGSGLDMKFRDDGTNIAYSVKMSFTSLRRMFNTGGISTKIDNLINNIKQK